MCTFHVDKTPTPSDSTSMYHLLQNASVCKYFRHQDGPVRTGTPCHRKDGNRRHGQQEDRDHAGPAAVGDKAVFAEAPLGGRDGVAQRWGWCVSCFLCCLSHTWLEWCVIYVFLMKLMIKSGACSCQDDDQRLGCHRAVLFSRQCSQTTAVVWHRRRSQQRSGVHEGGALASEAGGVWVNMQGPLLHLFMGLPQVENQHLTAPNMRRRLEWCTSILQRPGEAKKRHLGCCSFEAHISRSAQVIFLFVPSHTPHDVHTVLCRTVSRISIAVSRSLGSSVSARLCLGAFCRVHDAVSPANCM